MMPHHSPLTVWVNKEFQQALNEQYDLRNNETHDDILWQTAVLRYPILSALLLQHYRIGHPSHHKSYERFSSLCAALPRILSENLLALDNTALMMLAYALDEPTFELLPLVIKRRLMAEPRFDRQSIAHYYSTSFVTILLQQREADQRDLFDASEQAALNVFFQKQRLFYGDGSIADNCTALVMQIRALLHQRQRPKEERYQLLYLFATADSRDEFLSRCAFLKSNNWSTADNVLLLEVITHQQTGQDLEQLLGQSFHHMISYLPAIEAYYSMKMAEVDYLKQNIIDLLADLIELSASDWSGQTHWFLRCDHQRSYERELRAIYDPWLRNNLDQVAPQNNRQLFQLMLIMQGYTLLQPFIGHFIESVEYQKFAYTRHRLLYARFFPQERRHPYHQINNTVTRAARSFLSTISAESDVSETVAALNHCLSQANQLYQARFLGFEMATCPVMSTQQFDSLITQRPEQHQEIKVLVTQLIAALNNIAHWIRTLPLAQEIAVEAPAPVLLVVPQQQNRPAQRQNLLR